jgi:nucleotide-binding universal stress UspA family protein
MKLEYIAFPIDFSSSSINALRFAAEIARRTNAAIHLHHVYQRPYMDVDYNGSIIVKVDAQHDSEIRGEIMNHMHKITHLDFIKGITLYSKLVGDKEVWQFYQEIAADKLDLIVMATRGHTSLTHGVLFSTNTERVVRHSPVPVLVVPDGAAFEGIKKIMFPTDFQYPIDKIMPVLQTFCKLFDAELHVVVINTRDNSTTTMFAEENFDAMRKLYPTEKLHTAIFNKDSVVEGIGEYAKHHQINMLSMLTHGRTGIAHLLWGSITESVMNNLKYPILTMRIEK